MPEPDEEETIAKMNDRSPDRLPALLHPFARPAATAASFVNIINGNRSVVVDSNGKRYIDALASLWYCNIGHGREEIQHALRVHANGLDTFHTFDIFTNPHAEGLAQRLVAHAPIENSRVFLTSSGSEAVETALKLARAGQHRAGHPERTVIISRIPSYHGVGFGGVTATGLPLNKEGFGPLVPDIIGVPAHDLDALDRALEEHTGRVAAIITEPVIGAGGVYPPADGYLQALRERCNQIGAYLIFDEVITGFGRLGTMWGADFYNVKPDLITFAKGVTSGYAPLGGVIVGTAVREPLEADPSYIFRHGHTYSGHPLAAAVAMANLDVLIAEDLVNRSGHIGAQLRSSIEPLIDGERVLELRGVGAIAGIGLGAGVDAVQVRNHMLANGVIVRPIGPSTVAICPPLVITEDEIERVAEVFRKAITEL